MIDYQWKRKRRTKKEGAKRGMKRKLEMWMQMKIKREGRKGEVKNRQEFKLVD